METALKAYVKARLAPYKYPRWFVSWTSFQDRNGENSTLSPASHMMKTASTLRVGGTTLEYQCWPGKGIPVLLLHEGLGSLAMWRDFPAASRQDPATR